MVNWLRSAFLNRTYRRTIQQNSLAEQRKNSKKLTNISVILDHRLGIDKEYFKRIGSHFDIPIKNVRVLTFFQTANQINKANYDSSFTSKNISGWGGLNGVLVDFCNEYYDVLINYYEKDDICLKYLSAKSNKKFSVGFKSVDHSLNDLIIEVDAQNVDVFISECIKYLEIFFTKNK